MNANEYRKTLTPRQADAFGALLESKLYESGYYTRNVECNQATTDLHRKACADMQEEFDKAEQDYQTARRAIQEEISKLNQNLNDLFEVYNEQQNRLWAKAGESVKDEAQAIQDARGDSNAERRIVESMAIAEYQKRLAKKNKAVA